jgi:hypothetical protein
VRSVVYQQPIEVSGVQSFYIAYRDIEKKHQTPTMINTDVDIEVLNIVELLFMMLGVFGPRRFHGVFTILWGLTALAQAVDRMQRQENYLAQPWNSIGLLIIFGLLHFGIQQVRERHTLTGSFVGSVSGD